MSWFLKKKEENPFLVLDIGTEAVKSIIAQKNKDKIKILSYSLNYLRDPYLGCSKDDLANNLDEVFRNQTSQPIEKLKEVEALVLLPPENFYARTADCEIERDSESKISGEEKESILQKLLNQAKTKISNEFSKEKGILPEDLSWLNIKILEKQINGYPLSEFKGYKGKQIEAKILTVFALESCLNTLKKTFEDLNLNILKILHPAEFIPEFLPIKIENGIIFDVGGRKTQLFFIRANKLEEIKTLDRGGWNFSERLFNNLTFSRAESRELKEEYSANLLTPETAVKIKNIFEAEKKEWRNDILELKSGFENVFFFGGGALLKDVRDFFDRKKILFPEHFKKILTSKKEIEKMPQFTPCFSAIMFKEKNVQKNL